MFFGAMVAEGIVASIRAAAAMCFFGGLVEFHKYMAENGISSAAVVTLNLSDLRGVLCWLQIILGFL